MRQAKYRRDSHGNMVPRSCRIQVNQSMVDNNNEDLTNKSQKTLLDQLVEERQQIEALQKQLLEHQLKEEKYVLCCEIKQNKLKKQMEILEKEKQNYQMKLKTLEDEHTKELYELEKQEAVLRRKVAKSKSKFFQRN